MTTTIHIHKAAETSVSSPELSAEKGPETVRSEGKVQKVAQSFFRWLSTMNCFCQQDYYTFNGPRPMLKDYERIYGTMSGINYRKHWEKACRAWDKANERNIRFEQTSQPPKISGT